MYIQNNKHCEKYGAIECPSQQTTESTNQLKRRTCLQSNTTYQSCLASFIDGCVERVYFAFDAVPASSIDKTHNVL